MKEVALPPIAAFIPSTLIEWDDRVSAAVVLQGCNFRCPFCHSAKMVPIGPPEDEVPPEAVEEELLARDGWLDGVVVSGGEPTIHAGLGRLLERIRALDLPVKLDTNGSNPGMLRELVQAGLVQHVALDVKARLVEEDYERATGRPGALAKIVESLEYLKGDPVSYELRTTVVPGLFDAPGAEDGGEGEKLLDLARDLSWAKRWYLQPFRPVGCLDPEYEKLPETDMKRLGLTAEMCRHLAPGCRVRGRGSSA